MQLIENQWQNVTLAFAVAWMASLTTKPTAAQQAAPRATGAFALVSGLKLYYEIHGAAIGNKPPLVLLHGGGSTIETTFGRVLPSLAKSRQVIAFDQQGHGRTADIPDRQFTFEQSADDAAALLQHLKIERADFFGFSNGGNIALQIALRHPSRVRKLVVASAMVKRDGLYPQVWEFIKSSTLQDMPQVLKDAYRQVAPHPEQLQSFHDKSAKRMMDFQDLRPADLRSIEAPTLLMIGDADSVRPEHAVEMFRLLPHARFSVLPGGHGSYIGEVSAAKLEDAQVRFSASSKTESKTPDLVVAVIEEFLDAPMPQPKAEKTTISSNQPDDWPRLFSQHLNAGVLDAVVALYEPDARFVTMAGDTLIGRDRIRPVLAAMIDSKTKLHSRVVKAVTVDDIATLFTDFDGTTLDASGKSAELRHKAIEVLRRQRDGTWKLIVGDPNARDPNK